MICAKGWIFETKNLVQRFGVCLSWECKATDRACLPEAHTQWLDEAPSGNLQTFIFNCLLHCHQCMRSCKRHISIIITNPSKPCYTNMHVLTCINMHVLHVLNSRGPPFRFRLFPLTVLCKELQIACKKFRSF